jgi:hypothetical protein
VIFVGPFFTIGPTAKSGDGDLPFSAPIAHFLSTFSPLPNQCLSFFPRSSGHKHPPVVFNTEESNGFCRRKKDG